MSAEKDSGARAPLLGHLDCSSGVSGDKFVCALLDAGTQSGAFTIADVEAIAQELAPEAVVTAGHVDSRGIAALGLTVTAQGQPAHRTWRDIRELLQRASLPEGVRADALRTFEELAHAEARVHGTDVEDVHFHEVGALDSIVDIVAACAGMHALGIDLLVATPVATGWGTVASSHGSLPVPAPATVALLEGVPTVPGVARPDGLAPGELTTPTGAALVRALVGVWGPCPPLTPLLVGYGAGTRDLGYPNVCRLILGHPLEAPVDLHTQTVSLLETNIDHLPPEAASIAAEQLLAEGALDVWITPIVMKKGRAAFTLSLLCSTPDAEKFAGRIVALTGTLGVRMTEQPRLITERSHLEVDTAWGTVRFKVGAGVVRAEADDVERIAKETGQAPADVAQMLERIAREHLDD